MHTACPAPDLATVRAKRCPCLSQVNLALGVAPTSLRIDPQPCSVVTRGGNPSRPPQAAAVRLLVPHSRAPWRSRSGPASPAPPTLGHSIAPRCALRAALQDV